MEKIKLLLVIVALCCLFFIVGLYAGGWVWITLSDVKQPLSLLTLFNQGGVQSLTDKSRMLLPWAWSITAAITFFPAGVSLLAMTSGSNGNRKDLHGNARFANKRELRRLWYTGPEQEERD
ncbi:hypothetical protein [Pectobacterium carotovorum]|uniref:hypothetical protein n=1 Tax=Pectobacterium carotovorum TaxID=554 RepID=UPI000907CDAC|nr:hypothetical protein [Pectobacterium carotovorum]